MKARPTAIGFLILGVFIFALTIVSGVFASLILLPLFYVIVWAAGLLGIEVSWYAFLILYLPVMILFLGIVFYYLFVGRVRR